MKTFHWRMFFMVSLITYIHAVHNDWFLVNILMAGAMGWSYDRKGKKKTRRGQ